MIASEGVLGLCILFTFSLTAEEIRCVFDDI